MNKKMVAILIELSKKLNKWHHDCDCNDTVEMKKYELQIDDIIDDIKNGSDIVCPFCGEVGFDLIGLKHHLIYSIYSCKQFGQIKPF